MTLFTSVIVLQQKVYFGTTAGQLIVMDVHGAMVSEVQLAAGVTSMAWSAEKFTMEEDETCDRSQKGINRSFQGRPERVDLSSRRTIVMHVNAFMMYVQAQMTGITCWPFVLLTVTSSCYDRSMMYHRLRYAAI